MGEMGEMGESDGTLLVSWLRLLGWVVLIEETDGQLVARAQHEGAVGDVLEVKASAHDRAELAWRLFRSAVVALEQQRTPRAA
jgi:hypothetical protein